MKPLSLVLAGLFSMGMIMAANLFADQQVSDATPTAAALEALVKEKGSTPEELEKLADELEKKYEDA